MKYQVIHAETADSQIRKIVLFIAEKFVPKSLSKNWMNWKQASLPSATTPGSALIRNILC